MHNSKNNHLIHKAFQAIADHDLDQLKEYLSEGLDINAIECKEGKTLVNEAFITRNREAAIFLINAGADLAIVDDYGQAPFHNGILNNVDIDLFALLIEKGANVNQSTNTGTSLHMAAERGNFEVLKLLIEKGNTAINTVSIQGHSALDYAIQSGNEESVRFLLEKGAWVNKKDIFGDWSSLHWAINTDNATFVQLLLAHGADAKKRSSRGLTPLHLACLNNNKEIIQMVLEQGADVHARDDKGDTPLHLCFDLEIIRLLLSHGANPNAVNADKRTPFICFMVAYPQTELFNMFMEYGADIFHVSDEKSSLIHNLLSNKDEEQQDNIIQMIKILLEKGLDINAQNNCGSSPLIMACAYGMNKITLFLLQQGANLSLTNEKGNTALHETIYCQTDDLKERIEILISHGANINAINNEGETPLHLILDQYLDHEMTIETLFFMRDQGADFTIKNNNGETPFRKALSTGNLRMVRLLLDKFAANINDVDSDGNTALHIAIQRNNIDMLNFLLNKGINAQAVNKKRETSIHLAVLEGRTTQTVITLLLNRGVDINAVNQEGESALDYALREKDEKTAEFLKDHGAIAFKLTEIHVEQKEI